LASSVGSSAGFAATFGHVSAGATGESEAGVVCAIAVPPPSNARTLATESFAFIILSPVPALRDRQRFKPPGRFLNQY
jgi:hypothetical protein